MTELGPLDLEALIRIKRETITDKDKATLPILERILEEKTKKIKTRDVP